MLYMVYKIFVCWLIACELFIIWGIRHETLKEQCDV